MPLDHFVRQRCYHRYYHRHSGSSRQAEATQHASRARRVVSYLLRAHDDADRRARPDDRIAAGPDPRALPRQRRTGGRKRPHPTGKRRRRYAARTNCATPVNPGAGSNDPHPVNPDSVRSDSVDPGAVEQDPVSPGSATQPSKRPRCKNAGAAVPGSVPAVCRFGRRAESLENDLGLNDPGPKRPRPERSKARLFVRFLWKLQSSSK